jgi:hypothetical protein
MRLLPRSRRGTWLLAGAVWVISCAGHGHVPYVKVAIARTEQITES